MPGSTTWKSPSRIRYARDAFAIDFDSAPLIARVEDV
jgi:hypothetical protein